MRALWLSLSAILPLVSACQRSEPAPSTAPSVERPSPGESSEDAEDGANPNSNPSPISNSGSNPAASGTAAPPAATASPSCVFPLAEPPKPQAEPAKNCPPDPLAASPPELRRGYVTFVDAPGSPRIGVEIADDEAKRSRGLMYRTSLPEEQGMLFSWTNEAPRSFWMRNTCIPLDMLFISKDGFIVGILEQVPVLNEMSRSVPCPAAYVLEVNAGWVRSHGVKPGTRVAFE
jgi:uncharacterized membrane protein (UPF0127 family)